jgi:hypothetical protein
VSTLPPAPRPVFPFAELVANPTPPGQITREWAPSVGECSGRELRLPIRDNRGNWF